MDIDDLAAQIRDFATDRDWEQFHTLRSLILSLQTELGELAEIVQWTPDSKITQEWIDVHFDELSEEVADVFIYLVRLADVAGIDLMKAAERKVEANGVKYPVEKARGNATKYTRL